MSIYFFIFLKDVDVLREINPMITFKDLQSDHIYVKINKF
jgi:hypothetical protein